MDFAKVPEFYKEEIRRRRIVARECPVDVYCSSKKPAWGWEWKLMNYDEISPLTAQSCDTIIVDSGVYQWGSPDDVLAGAAKVDAEWVMATDVTGLEQAYSCPVAYCNEKFEAEGPLRDHITEADGRHEGICGHDLPDELADDLVQDGHNMAMPTTDDPGIETQKDAAMEGLRRFMDRAKELNILNRVILPVQPPYTDFLERVEEETDWLEKVNYVAAGGLLAIPDVQDRIDALYEVREWLDDDMKLHALAPGSQKEMLYELNQNPDLVDSLDLSTPEVQPSKSILSDANRNNHEHIMPNGTHNSTVVSHFTSALIVQLAHMISPLCNVEKTYPELHEPEEPSWKAEGQATESDGPTADASQTPDAVATDGGEEDTEDSAEQQRQKKITAWANADDD